MIYSQEPGRRSPSERDRSLRRRAARLAEPGVVEMEPLIIVAGEDAAAEADAVMEMEPLVITAGHGRAGEEGAGGDGVIEMEPLTVTAGSGDEEMDIAGSGETGSSFDGLGLPLYLKGLLDDLLEPPETGEAGAVEQSLQPENEAGAEHTETESLDANPDEAAAEGGEAAPESEPEPGADEGAAVEPGAAEAEAAAPGDVAPAAAPAGEDPDAALRQWQGGVQAAGSAIPTPSMGAAATAHTAISGAGEARGAAHAARRGQIPQSARTAVPPAPQVESPPAPPATNPIPEYTQRILDASSGPQRRLAQRPLPPLVTRPGGTPPRADQTPVDPRIFQLLVSPERLAQVPDTEAGRRDRALVERARQAFSAPLQVGVAEGTPEQVPIDDVGAPPIPPLPPQTATPVGQVVARLLAQPDEAANRVNRELRRGAYPNDILNNSALQGVGQVLLPTLRAEMTAELRRVAQAAGLTAEQLDGLVRDRQVELEAERRQASLASSGATQTASTAISQEGGRTLGTIAQARRDMDEEAIRRQEAASGGTDPTVVEARRAQVVSWVHERVTTEITNFQRQGDARQEALDNGLRTQENAYNWAAQRDEYQVLNVPTPLSQRPPDDQQRLQDQAAEIRNFARVRIESVRSQVNGWKESDGRTIRGWRTAMETAGTEAIQAARRWADDRIEQGRSWWERIVNRITGWRERAQEQAIQWEVRTTTETRNMIAGDLAHINQLDQEVSAGATRESLLANQRLTAEQRGVINAYFATGTRRNPLEIVAERLEAKIVQQQQPNATPTFEQELLSPGTDWHTLNLVGAAQRGGFDASVVAGAVHDAVAGWGTNEAKIYSNLAGLTNIQVEAVRRNYRGRYGETIDEALSDDLSDDELRRAQLLLEGDQRAADAYALHYAVDQWGTDEETIMSVLRNQTPDQRRRIIEYYNQNFDPDLDVALRGDMSGHELDRALALSQGNIAEADAIALDEAMRGGFWWGAGTDEGQIEATYQNIRNEVLAQAQREGWSSAQMEAEVRRRNREVEQAFNTRYANVEEYRAPDGNGTGSVLQRAFRSELSGPELDLANALNENDMARADAARIEIERQSIVYADDEKINNTLRGQYERSLEAVRLDQGPERRHQMQLALQQWQESHPNATADDLSREQMRLEREMDRAMERAAQDRSRVSMQNLEQVYSNQYGGRNLRVTLELNMSGDELARARLLVDQGGHLTPYQELDFATRGVGTDEDRLRQSLQGRTRAEIQQIREEWERNHPGENFDNFLRGELSGREEFEIMDTVEHGAPESASERAAQLRRQMDHELNHGAPLGGSVASDEAAYLRGEMARLNETTNELTRTGLTADEREQLLFRFNVQASVVDEAVQDHQRAVDRVTDLATQVVGMTVAIVVGTVLTVVSGGALGPVAIALIASAASTISTMATKYALKGSDYGIEEIGTDLAVGAVDALASAATAGVGKAIVGRFMRAAGGAATATASAATRTAAVSGGNRISQALGRLATRFARSGVGSRINQLPGVNRMTQAAGRFARSQEGVLARVIRGGARETAEQAALRAANERAMSTSTRIFAEIMEESLDNVIQSAPSAFAASVLDDNNWHGNVLLNIVSSTGQQVGQGALMSSAMLGGRPAGRGVRAGVGAAGERWRLRTPEGRIAEGSRRMGSAYLEWVAENPAGSYHDFLNSSTGQSLHRDLAARNMLPTPADLARLPQTRVQGDAVPQPRLVEGEHPAPRPEPRVAAGEPPPARVADAEARARAAAADAATTPRGTEAAGGTPPRQAGVADEGRSAPRSGDPQAEALAGGLPERMRERVPVEVNPNLPGNEVRVVPVRVDGQVVGVRIEAGPHATPTDVMLHAHVVQGYERYVGLLGRARELIEQFNAWFNLQEHAGVGSAAFEARLEIQKLPAVIEERMARLSQGGLDPAAQARLLDEVNSLARQIETHRARLNDFTEGRGYVAAEGRREERTTAAADTSEPAASPAETAATAQVTAAPPGRRRAPTVEEVDAQRASVNRLERERSDLLGGRHELEAQRLRDGLGGLQARLTEARTRLRTEGAYMPEAAVEALELRIKSLEDQIAGRERALAAAESARVQQFAHADAHELARLDREIARSRQELTDMEARLPGTLSSIKTTALRDFPSSMPGKFPDLEAQIATRGLAPDEAALVRSHTEAVREYCRRMSAADPNFNARAYIDSWLNNAGVARGFEIDAHSQLRQSLRADILAHVDTLPGAAKVTAMNAFVAATPEPGSQGALFGDFRERLLQQAAAESISPVTLGDRSIKLEGSDSAIGQRRLCDGVVQVTAKRDAIPQGLYMAEDKSGRAGTSASDFAQAVDYHRMLNRGQTPAGAITAPVPLPSTVGGTTTRFEVGGSPGAPSTVTVAGRQTQGVIYFFQDAGSASAMANFMNSCSPPLDARIRVSYIGADGRLHFVR